MTKSILIVPVLILFVIVIGCEKDPNSPVDLPVPLPSLTGIFIVNEGNFSLGNASLTYFNMDQNIIYNDVFKAANNQDLGDTANEILISDTLAFIVVSLSDKIEIINTKTFSKVNTVRFPPGSSPGHIAMAPNGDYYITALYRHLVYRMDGELHNLTDSVEVGQYPEDIIISHDEAYIANSGFGSGNTVSVVSIEDLQLLSTITVGHNPLDFVLDSDGMIHLVCTGFNNWQNPDQNIPGGIWKIDPQQHIVQDSLVMDETFYPGTVTVSGSKNGYFLYQKKVVKYSTETLDIINNSYLSFPDESDNPYYLSINDNYNHLYILDARGYVENGIFSIYSLSDNNSVFFYTGIIPGHMDFKFE